MENLVLVVDLGFDHVNIVCCFKFPVILHLFCRYYACLCGHEDVVKYLLETGNITFYAFL